MSVVELKVTGLDGVLALLHQLPPELVSKRGGPVKLALKKAAKIILVEAQQNLQRAIDAPGKTGVTVSTGFLKSSLVMTRGKLFAGENGEKYLIRFKRGKYPNHPNVSAYKSAVFMEYGSEGRAAIPYLRPAAIMKGQAAVTEFEREIVKGLDKILKKKFKQGHTS